MKFLTKLYNRLNNEDGFSLIEMMVAVAVSSIILLMIYTAHRSIAYSVKDLTGIAEFYENVNLTIARIDRDISTTLFLAENKKLFFIGSNDMSGSNGKISFVTINKHDINVIQNLNNQTSSSDIKEVSYYLKPDAKFSGLNFMMRREANEYDDKPDEGGISSIMLENVEDIKFEFYDGRSWESKWDSSETNRFPKAVRTTLKLKNYQGNGEIFTFITQLKLVKGDS